MCMLQVITVGGSKLIFVILTDMLLAVIPHLGTAMELYGFGAYTIDWGREGKECCLLSCHE